MLLEAPTRLLHEIVQSPAALKLLQQPPPGAAPTVEQRDLIGQTNMLLSTIAEQCNLQDTATAAATGRMLGVLLRQQAARSAGTLVAWLQQQPEQLQISLLQQELDEADETKPAIITTANVWMSGLMCLNGMAEALVKIVESPQPGSSSAALAAAMLQQLEQSGT
jgi:hypothetical protein